MNAIKFLLPVAALMLLSACSDNDDPVIVAAPTPPPAPVIETYTISVTNLTYAQPMSPIAALLHESGNVWQVGMSASAELENLAESGDNTGVLGLSMVAQGMSSDGILMPGTTTSIELAIEQGSATLFSLATMLVNTNDAFTGLDAVDLSGLSSGESMSMMTRVYDAGTEANSEAAGTIPGPADGGAGFDAMRDDVDFVAAHQGVVTSDDGLMNSVLTQMHRFDNPALKVTITKM